MGKDSDLIQTGADKLIDLVREKKEISIKEAGKLLGVDSSVIEDWANFLEEESLVSVNYKVTVPYISDRKLSKKELQEKVKNFHDNKEILMKKAESTLCFLDDQADEMREVRKEFEKLKKEVSTDAKEVDKKLDKLKAIMNSIKKEEEIIEKQIEKGEEATHRFQNFVEHKSDIDKLLTKVSDDKDQLRKEVGSLITSARTLKIVMDDKENEKHIKELQKKFSDVDVRRCSFLKELHDLIDMLKGKSKK